MSVTATDLYFSGTLYNIAWVNNKFLTTNLTEFRVERRLGNPILSYTSVYCFILCLSTTGTNRIQFRVYNTVTDAQLVCTAGMSSVVNSGTLNFECSALKWSSNTFATQSSVRHNYMSN